MYMLSAPMALSQDAQPEPHFKRWLRRKAVPVLVSSVASSLVHWKMKKYGFLARFAAGLAVGLPVFFITGLAWEKIIGEPD